MDRLSLLAVLLPAGAVGALEFLRHQWLAHVLPGPLAEGWVGNALGALVVAAVVYGFVRVFGGIVQTSARETARAREQAAVLSERQRLAREMHDGVAQTLFYLGANLREVRVLLESGDEGEALEGVRAAEQHLDEAHARVRAAIADSRQGGTQDFGESLRRAAFEASGRLGMRVTCEVEGCPAVPAFSQRQVLAIVHEALTNAHRHGRASEALVRVDSGGGGFAVEVSDDGGGFDPRARPGAESYGLEIMSERARMLDGELRLTSSPGLGTRLTVRLPGPEA
ncbi:MAG TPA: ATP-binding protein [Rubrobacter sp.]|nr:ATP-binding protein [Rubrobacter sp.]